MKLTIDKKVSLFISMMIFVFGALIGIYMIRDQAAHMQRILDERASVLLSNMAINLEYPVMVRDTDAISRLVKGSMAQKDIVFCLVVGNDGTVLYQDGQRPAGPFRDFTAPVISKKAAEAEALIITAPHEVTEEVGKVTLSVSHAELEKKVSGLRITVTTVVIVVIIMVSLGTYFFLRRLVGRPVEQLVKATRRIASGDLAHKVSLTTKDEFEILGDSFDAMTESLLEAQQELVRREKLTVLGNLAGGLGNELRNPLGVMNNAVFFLKDLLPDTDKLAREYLDIIQNEIDNSQRIISDFVDFLRPKKPIRKPVPVHEFINRSVELSDVPYIVTVALDIPEEIPPVHVDTAQMRQVFRNLITNAVHAMPKGGVLSITARRRGSDPSGPEGGGDQAQVDLKGSEKTPIPDLRSPVADFMEISVTDTGTGISPEDMEKLFQPLFTTKSRGIGLGLAICKSYAEANGGRIEVESELGKGTTFTVVLPVET